MTPRGEMPFLDHLEELRWRILWSLVAILVGTIVGWWLLDKIDIIEVLKRPIAPYLPGGRLVSTRPAEPFMLTLKVAFALGCLVASPIVIYQIWAFLSPALYERERRLIVPALGGGVLLFLGGAIACYQWLLPAALKVLIGFQRSDLTAMITIDRYFGMAVPFFLRRGLGAGSLHAQNPPPPPQRVARDTTLVVKPPGAPADSGRKGSIDSATARKLGLPTGPSRSFPPSDAAMDSLLKLEGFRVTRYTSDTFVVVGDSQTIFLRREAYVEREGTQLQADSIRYHEASCRLNASGNPQLFDQGTVLVGEGSAVHGE